MLPSVGCLGCSNASRDEFWCAQCSNIQGLFLDQYINPKSIHQYGGKLMVCFLNVDDQYMNTSIHLQNSDIFRPGSSPEFVHVPGCEFQRQNDGEF